MTQITEQGGSNPQTGTPDHTGLAVILWPIDALKARKAIRQAKEAMQGEISVQAREFLARALTPLVIEEFPRAAKGPFDIETPQSVHDAIESNTRVANGATYKSDGAVVRLDKKHRVSGDGVERLLSNYYLINREANFERSTHARRNENSQLLNEAQARARELIGSSKLKGLPDEKREAAYHIIAAVCLDDVRGKSNASVTLLENARKISDYILGINNDNVLESLVYGMFSGFHSGLHAEDRRRSITAESQNRYSTEDAEVIGYMANSLRDDIEAIISGNGQLSKLFEKAETDGTLSQGGLEMVARDGYVWTLRRSTQVEEGRAMDLYTLIARTPQYNYAYPQTGQVVQYVVEHSFNLKLPVQSRRAEDGQFVKADSREDSHVVMQNGNRGISIGAPKTSQDTVNALVDGENLIRLFQLSFEDAN